MILLAIASALVLQEPRLGTDTTDATNRRGDIVRPAGMRVQTLSRGDAYLVLSSTFHSARGVTTFDTVAVSESDLKPKWHRVSAPTDSAAVVYVENRVYGFSHLAGAARREIDRELPPDVIAGDTRLLEATDWSRGARTLRFYDMWKDSLESVTYRPLRRDTIQYRGRSTTVWVIQEDRGPDDVLGGQPFIRLLWIDPGRRKLLRRHDRPAVAGPEDGYIVTAR